MSSGSFYTSLEGLKQHVDTAQVGFIDHCEFVLGKLVLYLKDIFKVVLELGLHQIIYLADIFISDGG